MNAISGVLVLDKPAGITSARAVARVKRLLPRGTKVGHAGTLDPFAPGVLLLLIGRATKLCEQLMDQPKTYEATVKLGANTETDDPESPEIVRDVVSPPELETIHEALKTFVGAIEQRPPKFSALKVGGRRACDRVRDGEEVELKPRVVKIYSMEVTAYDYPLLKLRIDCGRGTYIRAIARDLGEALGTGGYLTELRRTRVGEFTIERATMIDQLDPAAIAARLTPLPGSEGRAEA
jgi:tRNA pseudouridine55 synthase